MKNQNVYSEVSINHDWAMVVYVERDSDVYDHRLFDSIVIVRREELALIRSIMPTGRRRVYARLKPTNEAL